MEFQKYSRTKDDIISFLCLTAINNFCIINKQVHYHRDLIISIGPLQTKSEGNSQEILTNMMTGKVQKVPCVYFPTVDVRDVADAHVKALKAEGNQRYAITQGTQRMLDFATNLSSEFGQYDYPVSQLSNFYFRYQPKNLTRRRHWNSQLSVLK